ncbi:hypothetical protein P171DRAFT_491957 [Karstenula rhodostoma CBS 690.94]|uniref:Uncharacterized protein n=1 Tax=Karstenula rhodostoma CBS 690.94 TaxID=1392251 RepID=A0A9P4U5D6_9PLEO|nr:hypothetical protein P171DRAFT_491957 [Karstenula rhodostoma CBS 690.94]
MLAQHFLLTKKCTNQPVLACVTKGVKNDTNLLRLKFVDQECGKEAAEAAEGAEVADDVDVADVATFVSALILLGVLETLQPLIEEHKTNEFPAFIIPAAFFVHLLSNAIAHDYQQLHGGYLARDVAERLKRMPPALNKTHSIVSPTSSP